MELTSLAQQQIHRGDRLTVSIEDKGGRDEVVGVGGVRDSNGEITGDSSGSRTREGTTSKSKVIETCLGIGDEGSSNKGGCERRSRLEGKGARIRDLKDRERD